VGDIYALGVIAFELLTGKAPFRIESARDLIVLGDAPPPRPTLLRASLPPAFDDVLFDALQADPERRTPSADAFRRSLIEARESATETHNDVRLLVADDDEDFLSLVYETLAFALPGARIECVRDGGAALTAIDREAASLAVIDLDMPGMNGVELTAALRATERSEGMPIIVATASGGAPDWHLLQALGADGFLVKPIDPFALVALVRKTLGTPHVGY
jgi:serine/threonine-protein kinase